ncbi:MAG TPA: YezD family protein [Candidatus Binataceae bacterium]|nr:YezD family protein [Candidatus Binataceae bacterium]
MKSEGDLSNDASSEVMRMIARAIDGVRYGSVEVMIQDGRVVQVERKEKFRLERRPG